MPPGGPGRVPVVLNGTISPSLFAPGTTSTIQNEYWCIHAKQDFEGLETDLMRLFHMMGFLLPEDPTITDAPLLTSVLKGKGYFYILKKCLNGNNTR